MATIKGGLVIPPPPIGFSTGPSHTTTALLLDAADEKAGFIVTAPKTGNIRKVIWGTRTVTTGATMDVRVETLSLAATPATPSGTLWATNTNGSQVVADGNDNTSFATTLTADAAVTAGDPIAIVIANPAGSPGTLQVAGFADDAESGIPYAMLFTASWAIASAAPVLALEYDDGSYEPVWGCWPIHTAVTSTSISTSTTPDAVGTRFQLPFPARARGCWVWIDADGPYVVKLVSTAYHQVNGTGILAQTPTVENEVRRAITPSPKWLPFTAPVALAAATNYRLIVEGTSATSLVVYDFDCLSAAALDGFWGGDEWHLTTAKDPTGDGDWTNYNSGTFRKFVGGLVLDQFDDGTGAGGGVMIPGGMVGGFRG